MKPTPACGVSSSQYNPLVVIILPEPNWPTNHPLDNHKPNLSSSTAPESARLKPTASAKKGTSYDLSFLDNNDKNNRYTYQGSRRTKDGQYVLIFDSTREVFILHKVDSMFNMNLIRTPNNTDANSLRREYPQLEGSGAPAAAEDKPAKSSTRKSGAAAKEKQEKKKQPAPQKKAPPEKKPAPPPKKAAAAVPQRNDDEEDESDDDDDFGLTIENPGGEEPSMRSQGLRDFSPAFPGRRFSEFVQENEREASEEQEQGDEASEQDEEEGEDIIGNGGGTVDGDDADGEDDDDDDRSIEHFKLPSPMREQMVTQNGGGSHQQRTAQTAAAAADDADSDDEGEQMVDVEGPADDEDDDLEAELMAALEEEHQDQESDVSEEE